MEKVRKVNAKSARQQRQVLQMTYQVCAIPYDHRISPVISFGAISMVTFKWVKRSTEQERDS